MGLQPFEDSFLKNYYCFNNLVVLCKTPLARLSTFDLTWNSSRGVFFSPWVIVKNNYRELFNFGWPKVKNMSWGKQQANQKVLKGKAEKKDVYRVIANLQYILGKL